jgi:hypothetical protein
MLKNWHSLSTDDCLIGMSLLGDPKKNHFVRGIREAIQEVGGKLPEDNPPYYWYDKIAKIVESSGWEILLEWDQNAIFPFLTMDDPHLRQHIEKKVPEKARECYMKKVQKLMIEDKQGIQFWSKVIIARKKKLE